MEWLPAEHGRRVAADLGDEDTRWRLARGLDRVRGNAWQVLAQVGELRKVALYCLSILSIATAVIHLAVAGAHFQEYWLFGVFMLVVAWLQLLWAIMAVTRPARWLLSSGAILNVGVIAVYIVTRTAGDVVGPTPNAVEPFGFGDGLCTVLEAAVAIGCGWLLISKLGPCRPAPWAGARVGRHRHRDRCAAQHRPRSRRTRDGDDHDGFGRAGEPPADADGRRCGRRDQARNDLAGRSHRHA